VGVHLNFNAILVVVPVWTQEVINSYQNDEVAATLLQELAVVSTNDQGYSLSEGVIRYHDKIWIGHNIALQTKLIATFHASALGEHSGIQATCNRLKNIFCW
jgi:hypothetical protein